MQELHFVASDIALEVIGDFAVVCLLSPKRNFRAKPKSGISRAISGLPGHSFQVSLSFFPLASRFDSTKIWITEPKLAISPAVEERLERQAQHCESHQDQKQATSKVI